MSREHVLAEYSKYLNQLNTEQWSRQSVIEGKISQIINQAGTIFSIVGIFLPLFYDKLSSINIYVKISIVTSFISALFFLLRSVYIAMGVFTIHKYRYVSLSVRSVDKDHPTVVDFYEEQVKDLRYAIPINQQIDNDKGTILIRANNSLKIGLTLVGALIFIISIYSLLQRP